MKFNFKNKYFRWGFTLFIVIAASICFYYLIFHAKQFAVSLKVLFNLVTPILAGFIIAYLLTPLLNYIEYYVLIPICNLLKIKESKRRKSVVRGIGIITTCCLILAIIYFLVAMMLSQIVPSIKNIVSNFDIYINNFTVWINGLLEDNPQMGAYIIDTVDKYSVQLEDWLNGTVLARTSELLKVFSLSIINILKGFWNIVLGFVIAIYVLGSKDKFAGQAKKIAYALFDKKLANTIIRNFRFTHKTFIGFVGGKIVDSAIIGMLCFVGTTILGTPYAVLVSVVVGVTNIIPFFGPFIGAIPSIILIFVVDPLNPLNCIYFAIFVLALQQFDGNVLGPMILGDSTGLAGFWVIFAITFFGGIFGVMGMVIGVPLFAVIYATIKSLVNNALDKKQMPQDTETYINLAYVDEEGYHEYVPEYKLKKEMKNKIPPNNSDTNNETDSEPDSKE